MGAICIMCLRYVSVTLVLIKRLTLEDESNTHLALGRGVRGEGACTRGHARERGRSDPEACGVGAGVDGDEKGGVGVGAPRARLGAYSRAIW